MSDAFPCHPEHPLPAERRRWWRCPACGTCVRGDGGAAPEYRDDYPAARGHHDPEVGRCKVRTLERWLGELGLGVAGLTVCEVGFGGGACLAALQARGARVLGLEPVAANRAHAHALGVPGPALFPADPLPALPHAPELWLFQDSFEHVPDPNALVAWLARESAARARVVLVAPDAGAPSRCPSCRTRSISGCSRTASSTCRTRTRWRAGSRASPPRSRACCSSRPTPARRAAR